MRFTIQKRLFSFRERHQSQGERTGRTICITSGLYKTCCISFGWIGVTPFRSMIKYATDMQLPVKIIMFDSNRNLNNFIFKKEFDEWASINKNFKIIYTISEKDQNDEQSLSLSTATDDWKGEYGRINKAMILKYVDTHVLDNSIFFIFGPPSMLIAMQSVLQEDLEIPKERIKVEEFTCY